MLPAAQRATTKRACVRCGHTAIRERRSDAISDYHGLQLYATKRQGDLVTDSGYTLSAR